MKTYLQDLQPNIRRVETLQDLQDFIWELRDMGIGEIKFHTPAPKQLKKDLEDLSGVAARYSITPQGTEKLSSINYGGVIVHFKEE
jgi:hypothetical protein